MSDERTELDQIMGLVFQSRYGKNDYRDDYFAEARKQIAALIEENARLREFVKEIGDPSKYVSVVETQHLVAGLSRDTYQCKECKRQSDIGSEDVKHKLSCVVRWAATMLEGKKGE